jgi:hypothetical protein
MGGNAMNDTPTPETDRIMENILLAIDADNTGQSSDYREEARREIAGLERELADARAQRDSLATICGELIASVRVNAMRGTFREATVEQIDGWLKPWVDKLAVEKGEQP